MQVKSSSHIFWSICVRNCVAVMLLPLPLPLPLPPPPPPPPPLPPPPPTPPPPDVVGSPPAQAARMQSTKSLVILVMSPGIATALPRRSSTRTCNARAAERSALRGSCIALRERGRLTRRGL